MDWRGLDRLFERIAVGVIFGRGERDERRLVEALHRLMQQSNRLVALRRSGPLRELFGQWGRYWRFPWR